MKKIIKSLKKTLYITLTIIIMLSLFLFTKIHNAHTVNTNINSSNTNSDTKLPDEIHRNTEDKTILLDVPLISQLPELYNGCEVSSLAMLLNYKGIDVNKVTLANEMTKDTTPLVYDENGNINSWGNPEKGFVGDVEGDISPGYAINPKPLIPLIQKYYKKGALNLSGLSLEDIKKSLSNGNPVLVWVTADFSMPSEFISWLDSNGNKVKATFESHTVLLTGYDAENFYYNDSLNELHQASIPKESFNNVWKAMGEKALTIQ